MGGDVRKSTLAYLALAAAVLAVRPASAAPIIITDQIDVSSTYLGGDYGSYGSSTFANEFRAGRHWGDAIQEDTDPFNTTQITITRNDSANRIDFDIRTWFGGTSPSGAKYADLFFDISSPNTFDTFSHAIALGYQSMAPGVYAVTGTQNSNDIWSTDTSNLYGGFTQFKTTSSNYNAAMALTPPVRLTSGAALPEFSVTVTQTDIGGGMYNINVAVISTTDLNLFDSFDVFWATADCNNDAIWGATVPAPNGLALLGLGLLAVGVVRYRLSRRETR